MSQKHPVQVATERIANALRRDGVVLTERETRLVRHSLAWLNEPRRWSGPATALGISVGRAS